MASEHNWLRDETGGSVYLRLSTRPVEQIKRGWGVRPADSL
jgi:pyruvate dehydrogenase E1 component